jgi:hypothetical protein
MSVVAFLLSASSGAYAQTPTPDASAAKRTDAGPSASATASASAAPAAALPPGHPPMSDGDDDDDEPNPHGHGGAPATPGMPRQLEDTETEDPSSPPGTIAVDLRDADDKPISNEAVSLGILIQSVAKGEGRSHRAQTTDGVGRAFFGDLETGSGIAYRVTVVKDGATFAAPPFQLPQGKAMRVVLHVYPVTHDIRQAFIGFEAIIYAEVRDDRIQFQQAFRVYNIGKVAWVPDDVVLALPDGFTALNSQPAMSDQGVDAIDKRGAKLRGTFPPGQHVIEFRWQLPWSGDKDVYADVGLPPQVAVLRVMAAASQEMRLDVDGLPRAESRQDNQGQNILVTERRMNRGEEPLSHVRIALRDLPTAGNAKYFASGAAGIAVVAGLFFALGQVRQRAPGARSGDPKAARKQILSELEELERARAAGDVGPKTYERARRELIDALARTLAKSVD